MKKKNMLLVGVFVVIALILVIVGSGQFAIIGASQVKMGSDGLPIWIVNIAPERNGEQIVFSSDVSEFTPYTDTNTGISTVPKNNFEIEFEPLNPTCTYQVTKSTGLFSWLSQSIFGNEKYIISVGATRSSQVNVKLNQKLITTLDSLDNTANFQLADGLIISSLGGYTGKRDCIDAENNVFFVKNRNTGEIKYYTPDGKLYTSFNNYYELGCAPNNDLNRLTCKMSSRDIGLGNIQVSASAKYTGFYYVYPSFGKPKVNSIDVPDSIESGKTNSLMIDISNIGDNDDKFGVRFYSDSLSFQPDGTTVNIVKGQSQKVVTTIVGKQVTKDTNVKVCVDAYTISRYSKGETSTLCDYLTIKPTSIWTPNSCGNGQCESNENFATCPKDCVQVQDCKDPLMFLNKAGQCECYPGYVAQTNYFGDTICEKEKDYTIWYIVIAAAVIIIMMLILFAGGKGRKR